MSQHSLLFTLPYLCCPHFEYSGQTKVGYAYLPILEGGHLNVGAAKLRVCLDADEHYTLPDDQRKTPTRVRRPEVGRVGRGRRLEMEKETKRGICEPMRKQ